MGIAVISLVVLAVVVLIAIPVLAAVFGRASRRNPNRPGGEGSSEEEDQSRRSGPRRD